MQSHHSVKNFSKTKQNQIKNTIQPTRKKSEIINESNDSKKIINPNEKSLIPIKQKSYNNFNSIVFFIFIIYSLIIFIIQIPILRMIL